MARDQAAAILSYVIGKHDKIFFAVLTCVFALGGSVIGIFIGALEGHTTGTGIPRGVVIGAMTGALTGVQLAELISNKEPFSKLGLICSMLNGKIFTEWVSPAVLKAYQWQVMGIDASEISDIFAALSSSPPAVEGLSNETIQRELPCFRIEQQFSTTCCVICLQDLQEGEIGRKLPGCEHVFHEKCIDLWLWRQGTCPICRQQIRLVAG